MRRLLFALLILLALFATHLVRGETRSGFGNPDTVIYSVAAQRWARGAIPYRDIVDQKPPLLYLFYRACLRLGGPTPRALWQGMTVMTSCAAACLLVGLWGAGLPAAGVGAAAAFLGFGWVDPLHLHLVAQNYIQSESLAVCWAAIACGLCFRYDGSARIAYPLLAGAGCAAAALSKQPGALWLPALSLHLLLHRRRWRGLSAAAFGTVAVVGLFASYFAAHGALDDAVEWVWTRNLYYAHLDHPNASLAFDRAAAPALWSNLWARLLAAEPRIYTLSLLALPLAALRVPRRAVASAGWLLGGLLAYDLGGFPFDHYFIFLQLGLALACGLALHLFLFWTPPRAGVVAAAVLAVPLFGLPGVWAMAGGDVAPPPEPWRSMAERIRSCAGPHDRLAAFQHPLEVLFWADLPGAGRYIHYPHPDLRPDPADYMGEIERTEPAFLYINCDPFTPETPGIRGMMRRYVDAHYVPWFEGGGGWVYRRAGVTCP